MNSNYLSFLKIDCVRLPRKLKERIAAKGVIINFPEWLIRSYEMV